MNKSLDVTDVAVRSMGEETLRLDRAVQRRVGSSVVQRLVTDQVVTGLQFMFDVAAFIVAIVLTELYRGIETPALSTMLVVLLWSGGNMLVLRHLGLYRIDAVVRGPWSSWRLASVLAVNLLLVSIVATVAPLDGSRWVVATVMLALALLFLARAVFSMVIRYGVRHRWLGGNVVLVGYSSAGEKFVRAMQARGSGCWWRVVGVVSDERPQREGDAYGGLPWLGSTENIRHLVREGMVQQVVLPLPCGTKMEFEALRRQIATLPVVLSLTWDWDPPRPVGGPWRLFKANEDWRRYEVPIQRLSDSPSFGWSAVVKLIEDKLLASLALLLLGPLLVVIALLIKLDSPGPVFFRQKRYGFNHRPIMVYKFRTMYHDSSGTQPFRQATRNDSRITRIGAFLRRTSLDELPQLFNVIDGSMSLVGPRPHPVELDDRFRQLIQGFEGRHNVKPGITGWAQINGFRGETDTLEKMEARIAHDIFYIENWSLWLDIKILIRTALGGWSGENAY